ncbi:pentatricopeptide repeat-containing protein At5g09450, mitochondrial isoform X2 [Eucalyptus grandis]|uniref:pentatricopeptide repeat-containing protein At5g09450, mitochondrial isoform X2 n=1 Tax=Eucalyptus grandis TaxID=71139 RepID=UPI00192EBB74|nr:pentatricopeptide repeat-containing protein At5g09450, mitochondrial isoform X2 [Eucalyptus grandis]
MGSRAFFLSLRRTRFVEGLGAANGWSSRRFLSSGGLGNELVEDAVVVEGSDDLKSRIFRLRLPKRSVTNVIQKWVGEGNEVSAPELRQISKELRKSQRYKHALEVSEWMVTNEGHELSDKDYADRIDLTTKVFGVDAAERYFEGREGLFSCGRDETPESGPRYLHLQSVD